MSSGTSIEWAQATWNPVVGCTRVSAGCDHCYAVGMTHRLEAMGQAKYGSLTVLNRRGERHFNGVVRTVPEALGIPLKWATPRRVFVNSMSDLFHDKVPFEFIAAVFGIAAACPHLTFIVLTKRPERAAEFYTWLARLRVGKDRESAVAAPVTTCGAFAISELGDHADDGQRITIDLLCRDTIHLSNWPLPNLWLLASVEDQATADERIPHLLKCPAAVRGVSYEPALGPVDVTRWLDWGFCNKCGFVGRCDRTRQGLEHLRRDGRRCSYLAGPYPTLDWIIVGGESGKGARPFDIAWARAVVGQGRDAGVPVFVKQLGAVPIIHTEVERRTLPGDFPTLLKNGTYLVWLKDPKGGDMAEWPEDLRVREYPKALNTEGHREPRRRARRRPISGATA